MTRRNDLSLTTVQFVLRMIQYYQNLALSIHLLIDQAEFWFERFRPCWNMLSNLHVMVRSQTPFHGNYCNVLQGNLIYVDMHSNLWLRTSRFAVVVWTEIIFIGPGKPAREGQLNACPSKHNKRRTQGLGACILMFFVKRMDSKHFQTFSRLTYYILLLLLIVFNWRNLGNLTGLRSLQLSRLSALKRPVSRWSGGQAINLRESGSTRVPGPIPHSPTMKGNPVIRLLSAIVVNGFFRGVFPKGVVNPNP